MKIGRRIAFVIALVLGAGLFSGCATVELISQKMQAVDMGFLTVRTVPEGAEIFIDGASVGSAPTQALLLTATPPDGKGYALRAVHPGYRPVEKQIRIVTDSNVDLVLTLSRIE